MRRFVSAWPALILLAATLLALWVTPALLNKASAAQTHARVTLARQTLADDDILQRMDRAISAIADAVRPSVVHIETRGRRFSSGSGWVFDDDGYIVTNAHVVRNGRRIIVEFETGRAAEAELIGLDSYTDIAVLQVEPFPGLTPVELALDRAPKQGERVFAFGSPFGFKYSMSEGIISALGRSPAGGADFGGFTNFIQNDAAVNPGNSGGPLVDTRGKLIGMNVSIATGSNTQGGNEGDSAGISFAIPAATIRSVVNQIIDHGEVARGYLGLRFTSVPSGREVADRFFTGIEIAGIEPDEPADRAGLEPDDLVVRIQGQPVTSTGMFTSVVGTHAPGDVLDLQVVRGERILDIPVQLGAMPESLLAQRAGTSILFRLGMMVQAQNGSVIVTRLWSGSPASEQGLREDDAILAVNGQRVRTVNDFFIEMTDAGLLEGQSVELEVEGNDDDRRTIRVTVRD